MDAKTKNTAKENKGGKDLSDFIAKCTPIAVEKGKSKARKVYISAL